MGYPNPTCHTYPALSSPLQDSGATGEPPLLPYPASHLMEAPAISETYSGIATLSLVRSWVSLDVVIGGGFGRHLIFRWLKLVVGLVIVVWR